MDLKGVTEKIAVTLLAIRVFRLAKQIKSLRHVGASN